MTSATTSQPLKVYRTVPPRNTPGFMKLGFGVVRRVNAPRSGMVGSIVPTHPPPWRSLVDYLTRIRARGRGEEKGVPGHLHDKVQATKFVKMLDVPTTNVLQTVNDPKEINFDSVPHEVVLKPAFSSSSFGVMVLQRSGDGFHDHLRNRDLSVNEILAEQADIASKHPKSKHQWILEEKVQDAAGAQVPDDFKFYTFAGKVGLIHQTIRNRPRNLHAYFDAGFQPLADPKHELIWTNEKIIERVERPAPDNWAQMLEMARMISLAVPSPFTRIDMYNTATGPVFGEFTLVPGTFYYEDREKMGKALSEHLGRMWAEAEKHLGI